MIQEAERQTPSVYLVNPLGETTFLAAKDSDSFPQLQGQVVTDTVSHKRCEIGTHSPESFSPFSIALIEETAPHKAIVHYENGIRHTIELLSHGLTSHRLYIPKELEISGNQLALTLPLRLDSIEAMRFNVLGQAFPRLLRGPSVDIHFPEKVDGRDFFAFTSKRKGNKTLGVMVEGAENVTIEAIPNQPKPTKDFFLVLQLPPSSEELESTTSEVSLLTLTRDGAPVTARNSLIQEFSQLDTRQREAQETWNKKLDGRTRVRVETEDSHLQALTEAFQSSQIALAKLHQVIGEGPNKSLIAGPKWPNQAFARDAMINVKGALAAGLSQEVKETLETFFRYQKKEATSVDQLFQQWNTLIKWGFIASVGKVPHRIDRTGPSYTSIDSTALMLTAIADYVRTTGDIQFLRDHKDGIRLAFAALDKMIGNWKLPHAAFAFSRHGPFHIGQNWKDVAFRWGAAIEVASQYWKAFKDTAYLCDILGDKTNAAQVAEKAESIGREILGLKEESFYPDTAIRRRRKWRRKFQNTLETIWPYLVGLDNLDDEATKAAVVERLEKLLVENVGIRAAQPGEKTAWGRALEKIVVAFDRKEEAYHGAESIWPLNTGQIAHFLFQIGEEEKALELLFTLANQTSLVTHGGIPETMKVDGNPSEECPIQTWSSGIYAQVFYRDLLGIDVDMLSNETPTLSITPANLTRIFESPFTLHAENIHIGKVCVAVEYTNKGITVKRTDNYEGEIQVKSKEGERILEKNQRLDLAFQ